MALVAVPPLGGAADPLDARGQLEGAALEHRRGDEAGGLTGIQMRQIKFGRFDEGRTHADLVGCTLAVVHVEGGRTGGVPGQRGGLLARGGQGRQGLGFVAVVHLSGVRRSRRACARQIGDFCDMRVVTHHSGEFQQGL